MSKWVTFAGVKKFYKIQPDCKHLKKNFEYAYILRKFINYFLDMYICMELDSFEHFFQKAKTAVVSGVMEPKFDQEFNLDMEGSRTLRILCYERRGDSSILRGRASLEVRIQIKC